MVNVTMARLTSLTIWFTIGRSSVELFNGFRFPVLVLFELHIRSSWDFSWDNPEHFYDQLRSLRTFTFIGAAEDLVEFLPHTPSLIYLHASIDPSIEPLLIGLMAMNGSNTLVPKLKHLEIHPYEERTASPATIGPLLTMVASRTKPHHASPCPLEYLAVVIPEMELDGEDDSFDLERQLHACGMSRTEDNEFIVSHVWRGAS